MTHLLDEIEGLPEGWKAVAWRVPHMREKYLHRGEVFTAGTCNSCEFLIVEKIQPRRIVLEETGEDNNDVGQPQHFNIDDNTALNIASRKIWKVKE